MEGFMHIDIIFYIYIYNCILKYHQTTRKISARPPRTATKFAVKIGRAYLRSGHNIRPELQISIYKYCFLPLALR